MELEPFRGTKYFGARNLSPVTKLMASTGAIAVQTISEPENYHGAGIRLRADARVRMQEPPQIYLDAGAKQKP